ncbi:synaptotagmin-3-like isoform X1 [Primulina huaijiensis]|uniref:synaptotagmin-3-like isoform X1 n=1 Tax=Primulina huaijiensis TaxID=1492673 RepID=UPI003CC74398
MGLLERLLEFIGFGIGIPIGLLLGFFIFRYLEPRNLNFKEPTTKSIQVLDSNSLLDLLLELPRWVTSPDFERVDWLNKLILHMWPYMDKASCKIIKSSAELTFAEYIGKFQIKSIEFDRLTLGAFPPKIHGVKAQYSNEDQLVLDLALVWAGNSDVALVIKLLSLRLNVQLVDLQISAATRVILRPFVPTFPCFSTVAISLMEKPQIDFGLRVMGGDIMAIPGLYQCVQEVVRKQLAKLYLWPQTYEIDILDSSVGADRKPIGILHVKIVKANNLLNKDFLSQSDPYVKLSLTGERLPSKKTTVKMNNLNPEWNEDFKLIIKDLASQVLQLRLYDWEKVGAHDYLGMQLVPLNLLTPYEKKEFKLDLFNSTDPNDPHNKTPRGQITVEMNFVPFFDDSKKFSKSFDNPGTRSSPHEHDIVSFCGTGLLLVRIISAEDVEGKHRTNPFVKIIFRGEQRKTKCIKKTRNPYWNEEFEFVLEEAPVKDLIHIEVMSKRRLLGFLSKESLGHVDMNLGDVVYNGHINEKYHLINSRDGIIHLELSWKVV